MDYTSGLFNIFLHIECNLFKKAAFLESVNTNLEQPHEIQTESSLTRKQLKSQLIENALLETRNNFDVYRYKMGDIYRKTWATYRRMDCARRGLKTPETPPTEPKMTLNQLWESQPFTTEYLTLEQLHIFFSEFASIQHHEIYLYSLPETPFKFETYYQLTREIVSMYDDYPVTIPLKDIECVKLMDTHQILKIAIKPTHTQWVSHEALEQYLWANVKSGECEITMAHEYYPDQELQVLDYDFLANQVETHNGWAPLDGIMWVKFTMAGSIKVLKIE